MSVILTNFDCNIQSRILIHYFSVSLRKSEWLSGLRRQAGKQKSVGSNPRVDRKMFYNFFIKFIHFDYKFRYHKIIEILNEKR